MYIHHLNLNLGFTYVAAKANISKTTEKIQAKKHSTTLYIYYSDIFVKKRFYALWI